MGHLGTLEGFGEMFEEKFSDLMHKIIEAYQPLPDGTQFRSVMMETEQDKMLPIIKCNGWDVESCKKMVNEKPFNRGKPGEKLLRKLLKIFQFFTLSIF